MKKSGSKKPGRALHLRKETIQALTGRVMDRVDGGMRPATCNNKCMDTSAAALCQTCCPGACSACG